MINLKGIFLNESSEVLTSSNRAFKYGDALFETLKVEKLRIFFLEDHYFRLMASMRMLRMEIPLHFTMEFFEKSVIDTVKKNNFESGRVRFTVFRKDDGQYAPITNQVDYLVEVSPLIHNVKEHYKIDLFKDYYLNSSFLSTIKTTNKIINVLASIFASENELDNCILLNEKKNVVEAINGNIFIVYGNVIKTPPITEGCIKGVLRKKIIEIVSKIDYLSLEEIEISVFDLQKADEVFITNVIMGIQPVSSYKKSNYITKVSNELNLKLKELI